VIQGKFYIQAKGLRIYSSGGLTQNKDTVDGLQGAAYIRQSGLTQKYYINGMGTGSAHLGKGSKLRQIVSSGRPLYKSKCTIYSVKLFCVAQGVP
jgi:hypothetical protein